MILLILKFILLPLAVWRLYRLFATDTGYKQIFRRLRVAIGVKYAVKYEGQHVVPDYDHWTTPDGSFAEGLTCCWCATMWWGFFLTLLALFVPTTLFLLIVMPLNLSSFCLFYENKVYTKGGE